MRILLCLLPLVVACQSAQDVDGVDDFAPEPLFVKERPSATPMPKVPPIGLRDRRGPPQAGALERDDAVADSFSAAGQRASYTFDARAGELSLFSLGTWGYERGWQSTARLEVRNEAGQVLAARVRPGLVVHATFFPFVAPEDGRYTIVVTAEEEFFRYVLERFSGYVTRNQSVVYAVGDRDAVHGYLADQDDVVTYAVELEAGVPVALRVSNGSGMARNGQRNERGRQLGRIADLKPMRSVRDRKGGGRMASEQDMRARMRGNPPDTHASYPTLALTLRGEEFGHYRLFTPQETGRHLFDVRATSAGEGGLFVIEVERNPRLVTVRGHVGDLEDDPVEGVQLDFLREPEVDPVGRAVTGPDGTYELDLPPGDYAVLLRKEGQGAQTLRVPVTEEREVNAIFAPRGERAGR